MINQQVMRQADLVIIAFLFAGCLQSALVCALLWARASCSSAWAAPAVQAKLRVFSALQLIATFTSAAATTCYLIIRSLDVKTDGKELRLSAQIPLSTPAARKGSCSVWRDFEKEHCMSQPKLLRTQQGDPVGKGCCGAACTFSNFEIMHQQQQRQHISSPFRAASAEAAAAKGHPQNARSSILADGGPPNMCNNNTDLLHQQQQQQQQSAPATAGVMQGQPHMINLKSNIIDNSGLISQAYIPHSSSASMISATASDTSSEAGNFTPTVCLPTGRTTCTYVQSALPLHLAPQADCAAAALAGPVVDVWVLAGQSNCVGWNQADGQAMPERAAAWPGVILAYNAKAGLWQDAVPNVHLGVYGYQDSLSCGPDMAFARALVQQGISRKVGLVPTAMGGSNLYEHWREGGTLWTNMVQQAAAAVDRLGQHGQLKGMLWIQGEADGGSSMQHAFEYGKNFAAFLEATRSALSSYCPQLPVVMAVMATRQRDAAFPYIDIVAAQQRALELPEVLRVDMAGFEFYATTAGVPGEVPQLVHLTKNGCCALGEAMAIAVALAGSCIGSNSTKL